MLAEIIQLYDTGETLFVSVDIESCEALPAVLITETVLSVDNKSQKKLALEGG